MVEPIAMRVHDAWAAEKQRQGFADHPWSSECFKPEICRVDATKHHADMLPYSELAEHIKEYDRVTARAALRGIEAAGYRLVPESRP
jgi:hypothetical protein